MMSVWKQILNHWQKIRTMNHGTVNEQNPSHQIPTVKVLTSNWLGWLGCQNGDEHKESLNCQPSLQVHWIFMDIYHITTHKNWFKTITQFFLQPPSSYNRVIILPTQVLTTIPRGNKSKLPYISMVWSPQKNESGSMTPVKSSPFTSGLAFYQGPTPGIRQAVTFQTLCL